MPNPAAYTFAELVVGQTAEFEVEVTEELVSRFVELSGDTNPLHTSEAYAAATPFGGRVAHGMLLAGFFSQLVGMHLPGRYALYLSQTLAFRAPCKLGTTVKIRGEVKSLSDATKTATIRTQALAADTGECLVDGEAIVRLLQ
ncbi:MAG: MaoC family dehydratase [Patescibacteria group bacterium]